MITREQALALRHGAEVHYNGRQACTKTVGPRGGVTTSVIRARVNGKCQTWKTRPEDFRLPVKRGLRDCGEITQANAHLWHLADDCPLTAEARD